MNAAVIFGLVFGSLMLAMTMFWTAQIDANLEGINHSLSHIAWGSK